ncbi:hypothetical protein LC040_14320 [Bacillus tianshenii]|nr:hypothetical protein LC040_14320 [Bacillus tianshenii]
MPYYDELRQGQPPFGPPGFPPSQGPGQPSFGPPGFPPSQGPGQPPFGPPGFPPSQSPFGPSPGGGPGQGGGPPTSPPPSFTPQLSAQAGSPQLTAVDPGSIAGCLYRYTYVWLRGWQSFWFYPTFVGRRSVSGYRWDGWRWVYFGIGLRQIRSFQCY